MDGVHQSAVDQILSTIEHGNLGVDETDRRLLELIQAEQAKRRTTSSKGAIFRSKASKESGF